MAEVQEPESGIEPEAAEADLSGAIEASPALKSEGHMRHESGLASRLVRGKSPF